MKRLTNMLCVAVMGILAAGVSTAWTDDNPWAERRGAKAEKVSNERLDLESQANVSLQRFRDLDARIDHLAQTAYGWAVIPEVKKGGVGIGVARGKGVVYEQGEVIGYTTMTQGSIGPQLGGQVYSQIILFEDALALDRFKQGNAQLSARASAVAARHGAAVDADYEDGVAIFTRAHTGLMFEASVGGQGFKFEPKH